MAVSTEIRRGQLLRLIDALDDLIAVLRLDPSCQWTPHFERCADNSRALLDSFTQADLNTLSVNVKCVFGGMDSFSDYAPVRSIDEKFEVIAGMENLDIHQSAVYDQALELKVIGNR